MKLYIGNLPYEADEDSLKELFSELGSIQSINVIKDRFTGQSKGFGFVEFENRDAGESAISNFDGHEVSGRKIRVSEAREREQSDRGNRPNNRY